MRTFYFFCICLTIVIGGSLLFQSRYRYVPGNYSRKLLLVRDHIQDIKSHITNFKENHGRYPTNDEGLSVLDDFQTRFKLKIAPCDLVGYSENVREAVLDFLHDTDEFPSREKDANAIQTKYTQFLERGYHRDGPLHEMEVAVSENYSIYIFSEAGLLSLWGIPYIYENRNGLSKSMFKHSPVNKDQRRQYSIEVDNNIFVYSVEGWVFSKEYRSLMYQIYITIGGTAAFLIFFIFMFHCAKKPQDVPLHIKAGRKVAATIGILFSLFIVTTSHVTCYVMGVFNSRPSPKLLAASSELLKKYHEAGVINDDTFAKVQKALKEQLEQSK